MRSIALIVCLALAMPVTCLQAAAQERTDVELVLLADAQNSSIEINTKEKKIR